MCIPCLKGDGDKENLEGLFLRYSDVRYSDVGACGLGKYGRKGLCNPISALTYLSLGGDPLGTLTNADVTTGACKMLNIMTQDKRPFRA